MPHFRGHDGLELAYRDLGTGRPLVLFHGFTGSGRDWLGPARTLAEHGHRVLLPDLRGHGESARPHDPAAYPPDVLADDGFALLEHPGLDGYDLGRYSFGRRVGRRLLAPGTTGPRARPTSSPTAVSPCSSTSASTATTSAAIRSAAAWCSVSWPAAPARPARSWPARAWTPSSGRRRGPAATNAR